MPCFISSSSFWSWNPLARPFSTGLNRIALMKSPKQREPLKLKHVLRCSVSWGKYRGEPARSSSQRYLAGFPPHRHWCTWEQKSAGHSHHLVKFFILTYDVSQEEILFLFCDEFWQSSISWCIYRLLAWQLCKILLPFSSLLIASIVVEVENKETKEKRDVSVISETKKRGRWFNFKGKKCTI